MTTVSSQTLLSRARVYALAAACAAGFATAAGAQENGASSIRCQYFTADLEGPVVQSDITPDFVVDLTAIQESSRGRRLTRIIGQSDTTFNDNGAIDGGSFEFVLDANMKDNRDDPSFVCTQSASVRGNGILMLEEASDRVIRSASRLDGRSRLGTSSDCIDGDDVWDDVTCAIHRVNVSLGLTGQTSRNGRLRLDRSRVNTGDLYELVEGSEKSSGEDVILVCECLPIIGDDD